MLNLAPSRSRLTVAWRSRAPTVLAVLPVAYERILVKPTPPVAALQSLSLSHSRSFHASTNPFAAAAKKKDEEETAEKSGFFDSLFGPESGVAPRDFDDSTFGWRWSVMFPAFATHLCIGTGWAWSVISNTIVREQGCVCPAALDWTLSEATMPMPLLFTFFGVAGALGGKWQNKIGVRASIAIASLLFGGGMAIGGIGVMEHNLLMLNMGYGVMAGMGVGMSYTPPIQTLMTWFPDRKGLATGMLISGFGCGALVFVPLTTMLMEKFSRPPQFLGQLQELGGSLHTVTQEGVLYVTDYAGGVAGHAQQGMVEAVHATSSEIALLPSHWQGLSEGLYAVGTGSTGAGEALLASGVMYGSLMLMSSLLIRRPHPEWQPEDMKLLPACDSSEEQQHTPSLTVDQVMRTPQFYLLGTTFACLTTGTYGLFAVAKGMMGEVFSGALPLIVTASFTSSYLMMLSVANLSGRFGLATVSDRIGCKGTFNTIMLVLLPVYMATPILVAQVVGNGSMMSGETPFYMFVGSTFLAVFMACGIISTTPAYEASLFGTRNVGAVHGRMLIFNSIAAVLGPNLFVTLRNNAEKDAIIDLLPTVDTALFVSRFGTTPGTDSAILTPELLQLMEAKTLTLSKLLAIAPADTIDPTPFLYDPSMRAMAGLVAVGLVSHALIKPVDPLLFRDSSIDSEAHAEAETSLGCLESDATMIDAYAVNRTQTQS